MKSIRFLGFLTHRDGNRGMVELHHHGRGRRGARPGTGACVAHVDRWRCYPSACAAAGAAGPKGSSCGGGRERTKKPGCLGAGACAGPPATDCSGC